MAAILQEIVTALQTFLSSSAFMTLLNQFVAWLEAKVASLLGVTPATSEAPVAAS